MVLLICPGVQRALLLQREEHENLARLNLLSSLSLSSGPPPAAQFNSPPFYRHPQLPLQASDPSQSAAPSSTVSP